MVSDFQALAQKHADAMKRAKDAVTEAKLAKEQMAKLESEHAGEKIQEIAQILEACLGYVSTMQPTDFDPKFPTALGKELYNYLAPPRKARGGGELVSRISQESRAFILEKGYPQSWAPKTV